MKLDTNMVLSVVVAGLVVAVVAPYVQDMVSGKKAPAEDGFSNGDDVAL